MENVKNPPNIEQIARTQIGSFEGYIEIKCPDNAVGHTPDSHNVCYAGNGDAENFIREFTDKMSPYLQKGVYWKRDFGIWHTEMDFKNTHHAIVMNIKVTGDFKFLQDYAPLKNYDMLIICAIFDQ